MVCNHFFCFGEVGGGVDVEEAVAVWGVGADGRFGDFMGFYVFEEADHPFFAVFEGEGNRLFAGFFRIDSVGGLESAVIARDDDVGLGAKGELVAEEGGVEEGHVYGDDQDVGVGGGGEGGERPGSAPAPGFLSEIMGKPR